MPVTVGRVCPAGSESDELVAQVDERHTGASPAEGHREDPAEKRKRLVDVVDLDRHVVDPDHPRHRS